MPIRMIDVTLRDGGYKNNHAYGTDAAHYLVEVVNSAGVDFVEVGYRKGPLKVNADLGPCGLSPDSYIKSVREAVPSAKLAVMVHPRHIQEADIDRLAALGVALIRLCVDPSDLARSEALFLRAKSLGMAICANFTRITARPIDQSIAMMLPFIDADAIYIADSNGSMTPAQVGEVVRSIRKALPTPIGFHAHNNLTLALANTLAAIESGATWIDASIRGMGRGAGNLATEVYAAYLQRNGQVHGLDLAVLLRLADNWEKHWMAEPMRLTPAEVALATYNYPGDMEAPIRALATQLGQHWAVVIDHLHLLERGAQAVQAPLSILTLAGG